MTLQQLLIGQFGVSATDLNEAYISVGTTPINLLSNNPNRIGFIISNLSTNTCYVGLTPATSSTTGLFLAAGGELTSTWRDDFNSVGFARYAVSPGGTSNFYVAEIVMTGNEQPQVGASGGGA
jgi:hypothetical protein